MDAALGQSCLSLSRDAFLDWCQEKLEESAPDLDALVIRDHTVHDLVKHLIPFEPGCSSLVCIKHSH